MKRFIPIAATIALWLIPASAHAEPISFILTAFAMGGIGAGLGAVGSVSLMYLGSVLGGAILSFGLSTLAGALSKGNQKGGAAFLENAQNRKFMKQDSVDSRKVVYGRARVSGPLVLMYTTDTSSFKNRILHLVVALAAHEVEEIESVFLDEDEVILDGNDRATNTIFKGTGNDGFVRGTQLVKVRKYLGADDQAASVDLIEDIPGWTEDHRLRGVAYVYVRLSHSNDRFPNGIPNISAIVKGKKVYDPRTGSTAYSDNAALCIRDYLTNQRYGVGATDTEIDDATVIAAANICDENVTLKDGTTQKRYTLNGVIDTADKPVDILKDMSASCAGPIPPWVNGQYKVYVGAYETPSVTIDESWLAGDVEVVARPERDELFNRVKGVFVDPEKNWEPTDFPPVANELYKSYDGGDELTKDIQLPFCTDVQRAQRIAKIILEKGRQGIIATIPCNLKALQVTVWDNVYITLDLLGWSSKVFKILEWQFNQEGGVSLTVQEETSASYDWNSGEATVHDPAPDTILPDPRIVDPPGNPVVTEALYNSTEGSGVKVQANLTWEESTASFLKEYEVSYKLASSSTYIPVGRFISSNTTIYDIAPGVYDFKVNAISNLGVYSDDAITQKEIIGLTAAPAAITGFELAAINGQAHVSWDQATDLDVKVGGSIRIKWSSKTTGATWENGVQIASDLSGISTNAVVPLLAGTYLIKAVDSLGTESLTAASVNSVAAYFVNSNQVISSAQHTAFAGTKTNMIVDSSDNTLMLDGTTLWDSITDLIDAWDATVDNPDGTGIVSSGTYRFIYSGNDYYDLGAVYTCRVVVDADALVYDTASLWDSLGGGGNIDDWTSLIDGGELSGTDLQFYIRSTNDNPSGSPTWGDWRLFTVGDYTGRAHQIEARVNNYVVSNNIKISELTATIDVPDRLETFLSQALASGGSTITYANPFFAKPEVGVVIQSPTSGDTLNISHTLSGGKYTATTIQVLNGGSGVARTVDVFVRGY